METQARRTWLVGEHNPVSADPAHALYPSPPGCAGARLARALDLSAEEYLRRFVRRNLMPHDYDIERWRVRDARAAADALLREVAEEDRLVLLGARVAAAFNVGFRSNMLEPAILGVGNGVLVGRRVLVLPHPSGRSRVWNNKLTALRARAGLERLVES